MVDRCKHLWDSETGDVQCCLLCGKVRFPNEDNPNGHYRNGGEIHENESPPRDCLTDMHFVERRPDVLANALYDMGWTPSGDELPEDDPRQ